MFDETPSSPPTSSSTPEYALAYYKAQYEQLESELAEFQASSQELESELEKDVEAAEARERLLQQRAEELNDKVVEWQNKYRQAKTEAGEVQNTLQKEITDLRRENRELGHRLRDVEVVNDDFERKARNTEGSLQDLERKWNVAIERAVMMEEEIRIGEQEREQLRIETQRLKGDLSDLRIEADVLRDKLTRAEARGAGQIQLPPLLTSNNSYTAPSSPQPFLNEASPTELGSNSSPFIHTPRTLTADSSQGTPTPPSPPISDRSSATANSSTNPQALMTSQTNTPKPFRTPLPPRGSRLRAPSADLSVTPKPTRHGQSKLNDMGAPPSRSARATTPSVSRVRKEEMRNKAEKPLPLPPAATRGLPNSNSLIHMRAITAQMKRLELRVQSAKSKLPEPKPAGASHGSMGMGTATPPQSGLGMPDSVTVRSRKRTVGSASVNSSVLSGSAGDDAPSLPGGQKHVPRVSTSGISRLSFGTAGTRPPSEQRGEFARPPSRSSVATSNSNYNTATSIGASSYSNGGFAVPERPASRLTSDRPGSRVSDRPQSRGSTAHSQSTYERPVSRSSASGARPQSRSSMGRQTPLGVLAESRRPRSSVGQAAATRPDFSKTVGPGSTPGYGSLKGHKPGSQSVSHSRINYDLAADDERDREARARENQYNSHSRAPTPSGSSLGRRSMQNGFGGDGASDRDSECGGAHKPITNFSQSISGLPERSAIPLPRRASAQLVQPGLGRSPSSSIPAIAGVARAGHLARSPSGLTRSPSSSVSGLRGPSGLTRSPSVAIASLTGARAMPATPGALGRGLGRGMTVAERMGRVHEGREMRHSHVMHEGELLGGKGERVTVSGQGVVGRRKGEVLREEQRVELERKRAERLARARLGRDEGSRGSSRPGSSGNSEAQSSPRKGNGGEGIGRMESVRRKVDVGETW